MGTEIERRFLVKREHIDPVIFSGPSKHITQGYLSATPIEHLRVRVIDGRAGKLTKKTGSGISRDEDEQDIDIAVAQMLLEQCRLRISKRRYVRDGFEIDVYDAPLEPLVLIERELEHEFEPVAPPPWLRSGRWREVTDSVTNLHLARIAHDLGHHGNKSWVHIVPPVPVVVLTGGPTSGKTTIIGLIKKEMHEIRHVPEVATLLMHTIGITPAADPNDPYVFNRALYRTQVALEEASILQAYAEGKKMVLVDRGTMDIAAYLPHDLKDLPMIGAGTVAAEYSRYDTVIYLDPPPREIFEQVRANNPVRREVSYDEILMLANRTYSVWGGHRSFRHVVETDWEEKVRKTLILLAAVMR